MASIDIEALNQQIRIDSEVVERIRQETAKVIVGQEYMIDRLLLGLLSRGHILLGSRASTGNRKISDSSPPWFSAKRAMSSPPARGKAPSAWNYAWKATGVAG